jgi:hypothetical protein
VCWDLWRLWTSWQRGCYAAVRTNRDSSGKSSNTIQAKAITDSGVPEKADAMPSEQVDGMARNGWTASTGFAGRHGLDYAL